MMQIVRLILVWGAAITFLPARNCYLYLFAIIDMATRKVLNWELTNTMLADFNVDALNEVIAKYGPTEIMNTD